MNSPIAADCALAAAAAPEPPAAQFVQAVQEAMPFARVLRLPGRNTL